MATLMRAHDASATLGTEQAGPQPAGGVSPEFVEATERFRRELLAHCYRMLGSVDDAEDAVQETYFRAWRSFDSFEGRSSLRVWLYRIATNTCLTHIERRSRRYLPSALGTPSQDVLTRSGPASADIAWLQPLPDTLVREDQRDPAEIAASRDSLRLALIACLQYLPGRQRAVLILRDVLDWPAAEVAVLLDITIAAVKSALQRARARLKAVGSAVEQIVEPSGPKIQALLAGYIAAFENADPSLLTQVLRADATIEMPPAQAWIAGRLLCIRFLSQLFGDAGSWRLIPTSANGQPAVAGYRRDDRGSYRAFGIAVLTMTETGISRIVAFDDPRMVEWSGLPPILLEKG